MCACKPLKSLLSQKKFWGGYFIALFACASLGEATTWFAVAYAFFVISIALTSYGYNRSVMKEQAAKAKKNALKGAGYLGNFRDTQVPINLIYGRHKVGVNQVFIEVKDDNTLCFIGCLGEGPIKGVRRSIIECLGLQVMFGEKHLHLWHGFRTDEYDNYNLALGTGTQDKLPVYTWASIDDDPMRYTAYMGFRLHWDESDDFDQLGGFPNTTAEVQGLIIQDPRVVLGHEGLLMQYREHLFDTPTAAYMIFSQATYVGTDCLRMQVMGGIGGAHLFHSFPRDWLHGKKVRVTWRGVQSAAAPILKTIGYVRVVDGELDRTCDYHFPAGQYNPEFSSVHLAGTLDVVTAAADPWRTDTFTINCSAANESTVTLCISVKDDDPFRMFGIYVSELQILEAGGAIIVHETFSGTDTLVKEVDGTEKDYGTWNLTEVAPDTPWYSDNPALVIYDVMRNERYGGAVPDAFFHLDSVKDAANWCDNQGYKCNLAIYEQQYLLDVVSDIASTFRMAVIFSAGLFKFLCFDYEVPVMTFNEGEMRADSFRVILPPAQSVPTQVRMKFPNKDNYYSPEDLVLPGSDFIAAEGEVREKEIQGVGITDYELARKLATYQLERAYYCNQYYFTVGMNGYPLEGRGCDLRFSFGGGLAY